jgi:4-amino-4-deoxy-L-arabinose transferase-like glycosyltransferase
LKLLVVAVSPSVELVLDEANYVEIAQYFLAHGHFEGAFRPPVYPLFVAFCQAIGGNTATPVRIGHALISTGAGWVLYRWLRGHVGHRGALFSTSLWSFYPVFVGYTHLLWSETVFLSGLIFFFAAALPAKDLSLKRTALAAVLYGLTSLTRSVLLPFIIFAPVFVLFSTHTWAFRPKRWTRLALFWAVVATTIFPWSAHNKIVSGEWVINETTHGYNLWKGNTPWVHPHAETGPRYPGPLVSIPMFPYEGSGDRLTASCADELEVEDSLEIFTFYDVSECAQARAIDYIIGYPLAFLARGPPKVAVAFHPANLLQRHLWLGYYGSLPLWVGHTLIWLTTGSYFALILLIGLALKRAPRTPFSATLLLLASYQIGVIFITFGNTRFRLPALLVGIILCAWIPARSKSRAQ